MQTSLNVGARRDRFYAAGAPEKLPFGHGTATDTIENTAGANSFFLHAVPNIRRSSGPMSNVRQTLGGRSQLIKVGCPEINSSMNLRIRRGFRLPIKSMASLIILAIITGINGCMSWPLNQKGADSWGAANEGPMGRIFDKEIYLITSFTPIGKHNKRFLADRLTGNSPNDLDYARDSVQVRDMQNSLNVGRTKNKYHTLGAPSDLPFEHGTIDA